MCAVTADQKRSEAGHIHTPLKVITASEHGANKSRSEKFDSNFISQDVNIGYGRFIANEWFLIIEYGFEKREILYGVGWVVSVYTSTRLLSK